MNERHGQAEGMNIQPRWLTVVILVTLSGCATPTTVNKSSVQATAGAPVSAQVEVAHIPYDAALPKYVVTVECI